MRPHIIQKKGRILFTENYTLITTTNNYVHLGDAITFSTHIAELMTMTIKQQVLNGEGNRRTMMGRGFRKNLMGLQWWRKRSRERSKTLKAHARLKHNLRSLMNNLHQKNNRDHRWSNRWNNHQRNHWSNRHRLGGTARPGFPAADVPARFQRSCPGTEEVRRLELVLRSGKRFRDRDRWTGRTVGRLGSGFRLSR